MQPRRRTRASEDARVGEGRVVARSPAVLGAGRITTFVGGGPFETTGNAVDLPVVPTEALRESLDIRMSPSATRFARAAVARGDDGACASRGYRNKFAAIGAGGDKSRYLEAYHFAHPPQSVLALTSDPCTRRPSGGSRSLSRTRLGRPFERRAGCLWDERGAAAGIRGVCAGTGPCGGARAHASC